MILVGCCCCKIQCQGIVGLLQSVPSCQPSLAMLLALLPVMKPRSYSVANASKQNGVVEIVFSVFQKGSSGLLGCCTSWLQRLAQIDGSFLMDRKKGLEEENEEKALLILFVMAENRAELKHQMMRQLGYWHNCNPCLSIPMRFSPPTKFRLLEEPLTVPVVLVCAGTGIAPFRGFFQLMERLQLANKESFQEVIGGSKDSFFFLFFKNTNEKVELFFGCRNRELDYLFGDELEDWKKKGVLKKMHVAASREVPGQIM